MSFEQVEINRLSSDRQRLLRKVLSATTRFAALAGIGEDRCRDGLIVAQRLGLAKYDSSKHEKANSLHEKANSPIDGWRFEAKEGQTMTEF